MEPNAGKQIMGSQDALLSGGDPTDSSFKATPELLEKFCNGLGAAVWRFRQLDKAVKSNPAAIADSARRLRRSMGTLHRLHDSLDAELQNLEANGDLNQPGTRRKEELPCAESLNPPRERECHGFTLVELLVVIAIIGILAAMLLPALSRAKNQAAKATDINNLKQIMTAVQLYASDNRDVLPPPNWDGGQGNITGWLYRPSAFGTNGFQVQTGLLWPTLRNPRLYFCPMDKPGAAAFKERPQQISSYAMNGAVVGYDFDINPPVRLSTMRPTDCAFWETDEKHPQYFNDGANWPGEGVSGRHQQGGVQAAFDGSVGYVKLTTWYQEVSDTNRNRLWCYPGTADGGGPFGHDQ